MSDLPTDEARRALADRIDRAIVPQRLRGDPEIKVIASWETWQQILASLRAKTDGGASEMRERCALECEEVSNERWGNTEKFVIKSLHELAAVESGAVAGARECADRIRSLPLDQSPQGEGGGE